MSGKRNGRSRFLVSGIAGIILSIVTLITAHGASWASTTPMIAGGSWHTIALKSDGTVYAWGYNYFGQLGDGTTGKGRQTTPVKVSGISDVTDIAGGSNYTTALKSDGTVWAWGENEYGQLGNGTTDDSAEPVQVGDLTNVTAITNGLGGGFALKSDGTVWGWGVDYSDYLGEEEGYSWRTTPEQISGLSDVTAIASGYIYTFTLKSDGTVWGWGDEEFGEGNTSTPVQVSGLSDVTAIAAGWGFAFALKSDGTVWAWGDNSSGQLGDGTTEDKNTPVQVNNLSGVIAIACGNDHTIALKSDGTVWTCGKNYFGQLGDGTTEDRRTPVQVGSLSDVTAIASGRYHSIALKSDGTVWVWGQCGAGQLGNGTFNADHTQTTPVQSLINLTKTDPCTASSLVIPQTHMELCLNMDGGLKDTVSVAVSGGDCTVAGEEITVIVSGSGKKLINVSPKSAITNDDGYAEFTIKAKKKKKGSAKVTFKSGSLGSKTMSVKIKKCKNE